MLEILNENVYVVEVPREQFEELVEQALDAIPRQLAELLDNVVVVVEDEAPQRGLLGLYHGVPLTERGQWYAGVLPDHISIYRTEICRVCDTLAQVAEEVRTTVVHEVAHHFGIDDARLHDLGW